MPASERSGCSCIRQLLLQLLISSKQLVMSRMTAAMPSFCPCLSEDPLRTRATHADNPVTVCRNDSIRGRGENGIGNRSRQIQCSLLSYPMVIWGSPPSTAPYAACPARVVRGVRGP